MSCAHRLSVLLFPDSPVGGSGAGAGMLVHYYGVLISPLDCRIIGIVNVLGLSFDTSILLVQC